MSSLPTLVTSGSLSRDRLDREKRYYNYLIDQIFQSYLRIRNKRPGAYVTPTPQPGAYVTPAPKCYMTPNWSNDTVQTDPCNKITQTQIGTCTPAPKRTVPQPPIGNWSPAVVPPGTPCGTTVRVTQRRSVPPGCVAPSSQQVSVTTPACPRPAVCVMSPSWVTDTIQSDPCNTLTQTQQILVNANCPAAPKRSVPQPPVGRWVDSDCKQLSVPDVCEPIVINTDKKNQRRTLPNSFCNLPSTQVVKVFDHTFTPNGGSGPTGPPDNAIYPDTTWSDDQRQFLTKGGIQYWRVPVTGSYRIETAGANYGIKLEKTLNLSKGRILGLLVGQRPSNRGGGGGSFCVIFPESVKSPSQGPAALPSLSETNIILISGGGYSPTQTGLNSRTGGSDTNYINMGGQNGGPGERNLSTGRTTYLHSGSSGAGFRGNGISAYNPAKSFLNGGTGAYITGMTQYGGFGGGGCVTPGWGFSPGGAGGYSGGAAGSYPLNGSVSESGGGGSYDGTSLGINEGDGYITITFKSIGTSTDPCATVGEWSTWSTVSVPAGTPCGTQVSGTRVRTRVVPPGCSVPSSESQTITVTAPACFESPRGKLFTLSVPQITGQCGRSIFYWYFVDSSTILYINIIEGTSYSLYEKFGYVERQNYIYDASGTQLYFTKTGANTLLDTSNKLITRVTTIPTLVSNSGMTWYNRASLGDYLDTGYAGCFPGSLMNKTFMASVTEWGCNDVKKFYTFMNNKVYMTESKGQYQICKFIDNVSESGFDGDLIMNPSRTRVLALKTASNRIRVDNIEYTLDTTNQLPSLCFNWMSGNPTSGEFKVGTQNLACPPPATAPVPSPSKDLSSQELGVFINENITYTCTNGTTLTAVNILKFENNNLRSVYYTGDVREPNWYECTYISSIIIDRVKKIISKNSNILYKIVDDNIIKSYDDTMTYTRYPEQVPYWIPTFTEEKISTFGKNLICDTASVSSTPLPVTTPLPVATSSTPVPVLTNIGFIRNNQLYICRTGVSITSNKVVFFKNDNIIVNYYFTGELTNPKWLKVTSDAIKIINNSIYDFNNQLLYTYNTDKIIDPLNYEYVKIQSGIDKFLEYANTTNILEAGYIYEPGCRNNNAYYNNSIEITCEDDSLRSASVKNIIKFYDEGILYIYFIGEVSSPSWVLCKFKKGYTEEPTKIKSTDDNSIIFTKRPDNILVDNSDHVFTLYTDILPTFAVNFYKTDLKDGESKYEGQDPRNCGYSLVTVNGKYSKSNNETITSATTIDQCKISCDSKPSCSMWELKGTICKHYIFDEKETTITGLYNLLDKYYYSPQVIEGNSLNKHDNVESFSYCNYLCDITNRCGLFTYNSVQKTCELFGRGEKIQSLTGLSVGCTDMCGATEGCYTSINNNGKCDLYGIKNGDPYTYTGLSPEIQKKIVFEDVITFRNYNTFNDYVTFLPNGTCKIANFSNGQVIGETLCIYAISCIGKYDWESATKFLIFLNNGYTFEYVKEPLANDKGTYKKIVNLNDDVLFIETTAWFYKRTFYDDKSNLYYHFESLDDVFLATYKFTQRNVYQSVSTRFVNDISENFTIMSRLREDKKYGKYKVSSVNGSITMTFDNAISGPYLVNKDTNLVWGGITYNPYNCQLTSGLRDFNLSASKIINRPEPTSSDTYYYDVSEAQADCFNTPGAIGFVYNKTNSYGYLIFDDQPIVTNVPGKTASILANQMGSWDPTKVTDDLHDIERNHDIRDSYYSLNLTNKLLWKNNWIRPTGYRKSVSETASAYIGEKTVTFWYHNIDKESYTRPLCQNGFIDDPTNNTITYILSCYPLFHDNESFVAKNYCISFPLYRFLSGMVFTSSNKQTVYPTTININGIYIDGSTVKSGGQTNLSINVYSLSIDSSININYVTFNGRFIGLDNNGNPKTNYYPDDDTYRWSVTLFLSTIDSKLNILLGNDLFQSYILLKSESTTIPTIIPPDPKYTKIEFLNVDNNDNLCFYKIVNSDGTIESLELCSWSINGNYMIINLKGEDLLFVISGYKPDLIDEDGFIYTREQNLTSNVIATGKELLTETYSNRGIWNEITSQYNMPKPNYSTGATYFDKDLDHNKVDYRIVNTDSTYNCVYKFFYDSTFPNILQQDEINIPTGLYSKIVNNIGYSVVAIVSNSSDDNFYGSYGIVRGKPFTITGNPPITDTPKNNPLRPLVVDNAAINVLENWNDPRTKDSEKALAVIGVVLFVFLNFGAPRRRRSTKTNKQPSEKDKFEQGKKEAQDKLEQGTPDREPNIASFRSSVSGSGRTSASSSFRIAEQGIRPNKIPDTPISFGSPSNIERQVIWGPRNPTFVNDGAGPNPTIRIHPERVTRVLQSGERPPLNSRLIDHLKLNGADNLVFNKMTSGSKLSKNPLYESKGTGTPLEKRLTGKSASQDENMQPTSKRTDGFSKGDQIVIGEGNKAYKTEIEELVGGTIPNIVGKYDLYDLAFGRGVRLPPIRKLPSSMGDKAPHGGRAPPQNGTKPEHIPVKSEGKPYDSRPLELDDIKLKDSNLKNQATNTNPGAPIQTGTFIVGGVRVPIYKRPEEWKGRIITASGSQPPGNLDPKTGKVIPDNLIVNGKVNIKRRLPIDNSEAYSVYRINPTGPNIIWSDGRAAFVDVNKTVSLNELKKGDSVIGM